MKHFFLESWSHFKGIIAAMLLGIAVNVNAEDKFYISDFSIGAGETVKIAMQLDCDAENYVAFQFNIYLPEGLTPKVDRRGKYEFTFSERADDHTITSALQEDGSIKVIGASLNNYNFWETSGDFVYLNVTASEDFSGVHEIKLSNIRFSDILGNETLLADETTKVLGPAVSSINISSANKWSTCVLQFDAALPTGVKAYTSDRINGEYLILNEATSLKAYTPYVLYAENGYEGTLTGTLNVDDYKPVVSDGLLSGAISIQRVSAGYVLQNQGNGVMFHKISGQTFTIPAGKCWLEDTVSGIATVRISTGATGIEEIENDELPKNEIIYSLDGQVVKNPIKGQIYIIGGKKVLKM